MDTVKLQAMCKCGAGISLECRDGFQLAEVLKRYDAWQNQHAQCRKQMTPAWRPGEVKAFLAGGKAK